ncbi:MAG: 2-hydroxyglutaryl-CoA dehydratase [Peptococcaceae bacterium BICA1-7]|nr:MAG: 2-hydroxyglutaryl-CoA dehydratase [Peptococcaceae bacterium BICA1-7]HBV98626.1 2-hydroxyglutaryl-CoA dehydratase [Desulfotomaculum sp.]
MAERIGITTTVPSEIVYAAGCVPVDLNNIFIADRDPGGMVDQAERAGYPANVCAWIKGIYSATLREGIKKIIAVTQGDCSNTHALMETLEMEGVEIIPFAFPFDRDRDLLGLQLDKLVERLGTGWDGVLKTSAELGAIRKKVHLIDRLTWQENVVTGKENHLFQVSCSDLEGDPAAFEEKVDSFLAGLGSRAPDRKRIRIGYIGVPPIMDDLYDYLEEKGARVVYNEVQRQFSMPFDTEDLIEQYRLYSYPYGIFYRLRDITGEIARRRIDGIIHYAQSFCYRQIEDMIIRKRLDVPVLTLEGDRPNGLDARTRLRIDSFIEMLQ